MSLQYEWVYHPDSLVIRLFSDDVLSFLDRSKNREILHWLDDSSHLILDAKNIKKNGSMYYDYSFMITPAFKALERWILNIAPFLGVDENKINAAEEKGKFNSFLNDDAITNLIQDVSTKLELKGEQEKELRQSLHALGSYLKNLRHTPAHCNGRIERAEKAETVFRQIVGGIEDLTSHLIREGVIV